jgi:uncharacterized protein (TIGR03086 family)
MTLLASGRALDLLDRALGYTRGCLSTARGLDLSVTTPCAEWDLRALLEHLDDSLAALTEAATGDHVGVPLAPLPAGLPADHLLAALGRRTGEAVGAWTARTGRATVSLGPDAGLDDEVVAAVGALEVAVHGWDVARSCAADRPLPEELAADLLPVAAVLVGDADRPGRFAAPVATGSPLAGGRLLAFVGRDPGWAR